MKHTNVIITIFLLFAALTLSAQNKYSPCYTNNMSKGNTAFSQGKCSEAKTYYATAKQCAGGNPTEAQKKIAACDSRIKVQEGETEMKQQVEIVVPETMEKTEIHALAKTYTVNGVSFSMKYVEGGTFTMGCTSEQGSDCYDDESPLHQVTLNDFWIGETEVTQALWEAVMGSNPSYIKGEDLPVEKVSWDDCQEFIKRLNQLTGETFRLPTEEEWEYAARGGNKSRGYKYAGSNIIDDVAWFEETSGYMTHPVKSKAANELGLFDMSGNVCEWCQDWYEDYNNSTQTNSTDFSLRTFRVNRGGCWCFRARLCRISARGHCKPDGRIQILGFRIALDP